MVIKLKDEVIDFFANITQVLIAPEKSFHNILEEKKAIRGLYFFIFFAAFLGFMFGALLGDIVISLISAVVFVILGLVKIVIWTFVSHIIAKLIFKGEGEFIPLIGLFCFTSVTYILGILGLATLIIAQTFFTSFLLSLLMLMWAIIIGTVAVDAEHKIGIGRSFLSVMGIPALLVIILFMIMEVL